MIVKLIRTEMNDKQTRGVLVVDGDIQAVTVEKPWRENMTNVSCIPVGTYKVVRHTSPRHGECFKLLGTEPRTDILIHVANWEKELQGCIGVGMSFEIGGASGVVSSRAAMARLKDILPAEFELAIVQA